MKINLWDFGKVDSDNRDLGETWITTREGVQLEISQEFCLDLIENAYENSEHHMPPETYAEAMEALKTLRRILEDS